MMFPFHGAGASSGLISDPPTRVQLVVVCMISAALFVVLIWRAIRSLKAGSLTIMGRMGPIETYRRGKDGDEFYIAYLALFYPALFSAGAFLVSLFFLVRSFLIK